MASIDFKGCTIYWKIKHFSLFWYSALSSLQTPVIIVDELASTKWQLWLEKTSRTEDFVSLVLHRTEDCEGPACIDLSLQFTVLSRDGSELFTQNVSQLKIVKDQRICVELEKVKNLLVFKKDDFMWKDVLLTRCKMWVGNPRHANFANIFVRTGDIIEQRTFTWDVEEFESLRQGQRKTFLYKSPSEKELLTLDLFTSRASWRLAENVNVECKDFNSSFKFLTFKLYLWKDQNETRLYDSAEFPEKYITFLHYVLPFKKDELEAQYAVENVLSFRCECTFINGITFSLIEAIDRSSAVASNEPSCEKDFLNPMSFWKNDLKFLLEFKPISDAKICTRVRTFPIHKKFLWAKSRALERKFKEGKQKDCVYITDVDDDTMRRLLLYVYTHTMESLEWEDTLRLYEAAYKYTVLPLRRICSSRLAQLVSPTNANRICLAAYTYKDQDLQRTAESCLLEQESLRYRWRNFVNNILQLCKITR